jgi:hypothetical protein
VWGVTGCIGIGVVEVLLCPVSKISQLFQNPKSRDCHLMIVEAVSISQCLIYRIQQWDQVFEIHCYREGSGIEECMLFQ